MLIFAAAQYTSCGKKLNCRSIYSLEPKIDSMTNVTIPAKNDTLMKSGFLINKDLQNVAIKRRGIFYNPASNICCYVIAQTDIIGIFSICCTASKI